MNGNTLSIPGSLRERTFPSVREAAFRGGKGDAAPQGPTRVCCAGQLCQHAASFLPACYTPAAEAKGGRLGIKGRKKRCHTLVPGLHPPQSPGEAEGRDALGGALSFPVPITSAPKRAVSGTGRIMISLTGESSFPGL